MTGRGVLLGAWGKTDRLSWNGIIDCFDRQGTGSEIVPPRRAVMGSV